MVQNRSISLTASRVRKMEDAASEEAEQDHYQSPSLSTVSSSAPPPRRFWRLTPILEQREWGQRIRQALGWPGEGRMPQGGLARVLFSLEDKTDFLVRRRPPSAFTRTQVLPLRSSSSRTCPTSPARSWRTTATTPRASRAGVASSSWSSRMVLASTGGWSSWGAGDFSSSGPVETSRAASRARCDLTPCRSIACGLSRRWGERGRYCRWRGARETSGTPLGRARRSWRGASRGLPSGSGGEETSIRLRGR